MKFVIDSQILKKFPGLNLGLVVARDIKNSPNSGALSDMRAAEEAVRKTLELQTLADDPRIDAWRNAYSSFGSKPKTYKNSVEALLRRVLKGDELPDINTIVNIYNTASIRHVLPAGGDDLAGIEGDITLTFAKGGEQFTPLGRTDPESADEGEVIYRDDKKVLCRRWNWRECDQTKMTPETKNVSIVVEGLPPATKEGVQSVASELAETIKKYCGGEGETHILNSETPTIDLVFE